MKQRLLQRLPAGIAASLVVVASVGPLAWAQPTPPAPASPSSALAASASRPASELRVIEDDQVRIEETRLRGQLQRITVSPKGSAMRAYEINVGPGGRDPSQDKSGAGQRVWSVLRF